MGSIEQRAEFLQDQAKTETANPYPISCYIRTLNEERRIGEVIRAARQVADEVIVVDSGSKDGTLRIATAEHARIIHQPWLGNGYQKRVGEDAARHNWVLDLDADEVVTPELAEEIRALFAQGPQYKMYRLKLITAPPFGEPWWNFKHAHRIKLYDKNHIRIPRHSAWDQFTLPRGASVGKLHQPLLHYAFRDIEHVMAKLNRVSSTRANHTQLKPLWAILPRIFFGLPVYFMKEYFLNGLILGGTYGFAYALAIAYGRWLRDVKMYERYLKKND